MNKLHFSCTGFNDGEKIPQKYTGRGEDVSPGFNIQNLSPEAKTIAVIMEDMDVSIPFFGTLAHWLIWNIPAQANIKSGIPHGNAVPSLGNAMQGLGFGRHKYAGPKPPKGTQHRYKFTVYALNKEITLKNKAKKRHLLSAIKPHVIQQGEIIGIYE